MTKNFTYEELVGNGNPEPIDPEIVGNYLQFAKLSLQPFRDFVGYPAYIRVGHRNIKRNAAAGGAKTSEHLGLNGDAAVDLDVQFNFPKNPKVKDEQAPIAELQKIAKEFNERNSSRYKLTKDSFEAEHNEDTWSWRLTNKTIIEIIRLLRLPYNNLIDEHLDGKWIHWGFNRYHNKYRWASIREVSGKQVNTTIKLGL